MHDNDRFKAELGAPLSAGPWYNSSVLISPDGHLATVTLPVKGSRRSSDVTVRVGGVAGRGTGGCGRRNCDAGVWGLTARAHRLLASAVAARRQSDRHHAPARPLSPSPNSLLKADRAQGRPALHASVQPRGRSRVGGEQCGVCGGGVQGGAGAAPCLLATRGFATSPHLLLTSPLVLRLPSPPAPEGVPSGAGGAAGCLASLALPTPPLPHTPLHPPCCTSHLDAPQVLVMQAVIGMGPGGIPRSMSLLEQQVPDTAAAAGTAAAMGHGERPPAAQQAQQAAAPAAAAAAQEQPAAAAAGVRQGER